MVFANGFRWSEGGQEVIRGASAGAVAGYNQAKVEAGLIQLILNIRAENVTNGGAVNVTTIRVLPGRDR